ncbi:MAG: chloride channel protein [Nitrospirota bacterium]|nr:MAG: chloride channel protein [Nitrospirota bacterium]
MKRLKNIITGLLSYSPGKHTAIIILSLIVGVLSGGVNIVFRETLSFTKEVIFHGGHDLLGIGEIFDISRLYIPLLPLTGALLLIPLARVFPGEVSGYGFPDFLEKVNIRGGIIKIKSIVLKIIAPAITIGSGGSAGVEGPIAQIGGGMGSIVGQMFRVSGNRMKLLIASGSAGGIAATFNAPIAGVMFATEIVLLGNYELTSFGAIVISAGMATVVSRAYYGENPIFAVPEYNISGITEIPLYIFFGFFIGLIAVLYIRTFHGIRDRFEAMRVGQYVKPLIGAFAVGMIGIFFPHILSDGYETIEHVLRGEAVLWIVFVLIFLKIIATSLTLGSGGAGGVFAPALFIGAMAGASYGIVVNTLFPGIASDPGAYATVGVGAFLSAATHAPLTGMFLLFEMTGNYLVIIPIMFASIIGTFTAKRLFKDSIDTVTLSRKGIDIHAGREGTLLSAIKVRDVMRRDFITVKKDVKLTSFVELIVEGGGFYFPVVDNKGDLAGVISLQDVRKVMFEDYIKEIVTAGQLATEDVILLHTTDDLRMAMEKFNIKDIDEIPVVRPNEPKKVVGILRRSDVMDVYNREILRKQVEEY